MKLNKLKYEVIAVMCVIMFGVILICGVTIRATEAHNCIDKGGYREYHNGEYYCVKDEYFNTRKIIN